MRLMARLRRVAKTKEHVSGAHPDIPSRSNHVELGGFEPPTSSMPWKRATDCAIAPFSGVALSATGISVWSPRPPGKSVSRAVPHPPYPRTPVAVVPAGAGAQSGLRAQDRNPPSAPPAPEPFRSSPLFQCSSLHPGDRPVLPSIA